MVALSPPLPHASPNPHSTPTSTMYACAIASVLSAKLAHVMHLSCLCFIWLSLSNSGFTESEPDTAIEPIIGLVICLPVLVRGRANAVRLSPSRVLQLSLSRSLLVTIWQSKAPYLAWRALYLHRKQTGCICRSLLWPRDGNSPGSSNCPSTGQKLFLWSQAGTQAGLSLSLPLSPGWCTIHHCHQVGHQCTLLCCCASCD